MQLAVRCAGILLRPRCLVIGYWLALGYVTSYITLGYPGEHRSRRDGCEKVELGGQR